MSVLTKEQLLEFKNQIKDAIMLSVKDSKKIPTLDISKSIAICDRLNSNVNLGARAEKTLRKLSLQKDNAIAINALRLADMVIERSNFSADPKIFRLLFPGCEELSKVSSPLEHKNFQLRTGQKSA
mmetsp:Transcript_4769/g.7085  ORF Transcript_4769/g.7085 Transcript_4769/m.7085 type:complete len:126 (+) Transcript_4769:79-456(+)